MFTDEGGASHLLSRDVMTSLQASSWMNSRQCLDEHREQRTKLDASQVNDRNEQKDDAAAPGYEMSSLITGLM